MNKFDENILCIKTDLLFTETYPKWHGLQRKNLDYYYNLLLQQSEFLRRGDLEEDPSYKQIIPQVVVRHKNKKGSYTYFLHKQVNASETRLNNMMPLALGGHVEEFDQDGENDLIQTALEREVAEESIMNVNVVSSTFLGLMYIEDENPVNQYHVGVFFYFDVDGTDVSIRETDKLETVGFVEESFLLENLTQLTYWSRVMVQEVF